MEERPMETVDERLPGRVSRVHFALRQLLRDGIAVRARRIMREGIFVRSAVGLAVVLDIQGPLALDFPFVFPVLGGGRGRGIATNLGNAEDGLPAAVDGVIIRGHVVAETRGCQGTFGPAVVDAGEVPVYSLWRGISIQLIADVNEVLHYGDVDIIDG